MKNIYKFEEVDAVEVVEHDMSIYTKFSVKAQSANAVDGLTKVHRRILNVFLNGDKNEIQKIIFWAAESQKSHPHNETSIGDTLAMMMQPFVYHIPFFDSHGHSGSYVDNKGADGRYLRCSASSFIMDMYNDYEPAALKYIESDSGNGMEKVYYIPKLPMALCLRVVGIATGFKTANLPSHIDKICDLVLWYCKLSDAEKEEVALHNRFPNHIAELLLPDVPIVNTLVNRKEDITKEYSEGNFEQAVILEGDMSIGDKHITIRTIPYNRTYEKCLDTFLDILKNKKMPDLSSVIDTYEDDVIGKESARFEIQFKRRANPFDYLEQIKKLFSFRVSFKPVSNWLTRDSMFIKMGPGQILDMWFKERIRSLYIRFNKDQERLFKLQRKLEAILIVKDDVDEVVDVFKRSETKIEVIDYLMERFGLSQYQANEVSQMKLEQIIKENREDIVRNITSVKDQIAAIKNKLVNIISQVEEDVLFIKKKYGSTLKSKMVYPNYVGYALRENIKEGEFDCFDVVLLKDKDVIPNDFRVTKTVSSLNKFIYRLNNKGKFEVNYPLHFPKHFQSKHIFSSPEEVHNTIVLDKNDQNTVFYQKGLTYLNENDKKVVYPGNGVLALERDGSMKIVNIKDLPCRASIRSLGNLTSIMDIAPCYGSFKINKPVIVFYTSKGEPNHVRITVTEIGNKLNILTGTDSEFFVFPLSTNRIIFTLPDYVYTRTEKRPLDTDKIEDYDKLLKREINFLKININKASLLPLGKYKEY